MEKDAVGLTGRVGSHQRTVEALRKRIEGTVGEFYAAFDRSWSERKLGFVGSISSDAGGCRSMGRSSTSPANWRLRRRGCRAASRIERRVAPLNGSDMSS